MGAGIFGIWLGVFFYIYTRFIDLIVLMDTFVGKLYIHYPLQQGLILGAFAGIMSGIAIAIAIWYFEISTLQKGSLTGCCAMIGTIFLIYMMLMSFDISEIGQILFLIKVFLVFLIPAALTGLVLTAISKNL